MAEFETSSGDKVLIDDEDSVLINKYNWHTSARGYVISRPVIAKNKKGIIWLHRLVNKTPEGYITDHINHDKLDNRKSNLRTVKNRENQFNRSINRNSPFGYRGITKTPDNTFRVRLVKDKVKYNYGCYKTLEMAIKVQVKAFKELYGEYVC